MTVSDAQVSSRELRNPFRFPMLAAGFVVSLKQLVEAWQYLAVQFAGIHGWAQTITSNWANVTILAVSVVCVLA